VEGANKEV
jgi:hypothetical protein